MLESELSKFSQWVRSKKPDAVVMSLESWQAILRNVDAVDQFHERLSGDFKMSADDVKRNYGWMETSGGWFRPESVNSFEGTPVAVFVHPHELERETNRVSIYGDVHRWPQNTGLISTVRPVG